MATSTQETGGRPRDRGSTGPPAGPAAAGSTAQPSGSASGERVSVTSVDQILKALRTSPTTEPTLGLTVRAVSELAGIGRSTVYRRWPTIGELTHDLIVQLLDQHGIEHTLPALATDAPFGAGVAEAWSPRRAACQILARMAAHRQPDGTDLQARAASWERHRIDELERWVAFHAAHRGLTFDADAAPRELAWALAAFADGTVLQLLERHGLASLAWTSADRARFGLGLDLIVAGFTTAGTPVAPPTPAPAPQGPEATEGASPSPGQRRILDALVDTMVTDPGRFVDQLTLPRVLPTSVLAKVTGVGERRVEAAWPTAGSLAAALWNRYDAQVVGLAIERALNRPAAAETLADDVVLDLVTQTLAELGELAASGSEHLPPLRRMPRVTALLDPDADQLGRPPSETRDIVVGILDTLCGLVLAVSWRPGPRCRDQCLALATGAYLLASLDLLGPSTEATRSQLANPAAASTTSALLAVLRGTERWDALEGPHEEAPSVPWQTWAAPERLRETEAALRAADQVGFNPATLLAAGQAAALAGVTRQRIYRRWPTARALNDDLAIYAGTTFPNWFRRVLEVDPASDATALVAAALDVASVDRATGLRAIAPQLDPSFDAATAIPAWEQGWLAAFATWWGAHRQRHRLGPKPGTDLTDADLALLTTALVEGQMLDDTLARGVLADPDARSTAQTAAAVRAFTSRWLGPAVHDRHPPIEVRPAPEVPRLAGSEDLLHRVFVGLAALEVPALRLVETSAVADQLGVSIRRAQEIWPSTEAFNADLISAVAHRSWSAQLDALRRALAPPPDDSPEARRHQLDTSLADACAVLLRDRGKSILDIGVAVRVPGVAESVRPQLAARSRLVGPAAAGAIGAAFPEVDIRTVPELGLVVDRAILGMARIVATSQATTDPIPVDRAGRLLGLLAEALATP